MNLLGCPFCAKCKENNFQSTGARKTARKARAETAPATYRKKLQTSSILVPKMAPKSFQNRSRKPVGGRWRPKTHPRAANRDQKDPKSEPRALQERPEAIFTIFPARGGPQF